MDNELFLLNMRALWRRDPQLAMQVDAVHDDECIPLERTKSGAWTARMTTPAGSAIYLHSRYDPVEEARRFAASSCKAASPCEADSLRKAASSCEATSLPIEDKYCFVVAGLGLGYHIQALFERLTPEAFIICSEPSVPLIATALRCVDLSEPIGSDRLLILTDDDKTRLHGRVRDRGTLMMLGAQFVHHPASMRVAESAHRALTGAISEFVTFTRMSLVTLVSNSRITCENIAMNLVHYVTTPPIDHLKDRFAGCPAIVVSAGPSLGKNIDQLKALKGRAVLCAVQTTIKPLLERGIVPDFVTSLDFHEMSRKFFEDGLDGLRDVHLVAEPKATWHVLDHYPGPVSLLDNAWARSLIGDDLGARAGLQAGATVSHLAFYLAVYLGCDPVIFIGQDLAYTGHVFYVPGVEIHRAWRGELNRFQPIEQKEWERIARNRPILRQVRGVDGDALFTDELLLTYLEQFEKDIASVSCRVINATEGGARMRGTQTMSLREAVDRFCRRSIDPERFAYRKTTVWHDPRPLPATRRELQERIEELDGVIERCSELLSLLEELEGLTHDPPRFNRRLVRVDELRTLIEQHSRGYRIVNAFTQLAELRRYSADRRIAARDADDAERAGRQIERDKEFISGVRDGAVDLKPILARAIKRITDPPNPTDRAGTS